MSPSETPYTVRPFGVHLRSRGARLGRSAAVLIAVLVVTGLGGIAHAGPTPAAVQQSRPSFGVQFTDCSELASITTITTAEAHTVVPASFTLAGGVDSVPFVVRVANCRSVSIDGNASEAATVAQLGVSIVSPDGTGNINNYSAWYYTTSLRLALKLRGSGVPSQWVPRLGYDVLPNSATTGRLRIDVAAGHPAFRVTAPVVEPVADAVPFQANWWIQYNRFAQAHMTVATNRL
jgi:hypothetical protein